MASKTRIVTIVGGGNGAHVLAGYVGARDDHEVRMFNLLEAENAKFARKLTVHHKDGRPDVTGKQISHK